MAYTVILSPNRDFLPPRLTGSASKSFGTVQTMDLNQYLSKSDRNRFRYSGVDMAIDTPRNSLICC